MTKIYFCEKLNYLVLIGADPRLWITLLKLAWPPPPPPPSRFTRSVKIDAEFVSITSAWKSMQIKFQLIGHIHSYHIFLGLQFPRTFLVARKIGPIPTKNVREKAFFRFTMIIRFSFWNNRSSRCSRCCRCSQCNTHAQQKNANVFMHFNSLLIFNRRITLNNSWVPNDFRCFLFFFDLKTNAWKFHNEIIAIADSSRPVSGNPFDAKRHLNFIFKKKRALLLSVLSRWWWCRPIVCEYKIVFDADDVGIVLIE